MRLGTNVVRTVDLPDTPDTPPDPALDPRVDAAFATLRQELDAVRQQMAALAALRHQVAVLRQAIARLAQEVQQPDPDARRLLEQLGLDPDAPEGHTD